jgi:hypothetical protein
MEEFCKDHITLVADIAVIKTTTEAIDKRINGSIDDIHDHIKAGSNWRLGIVGVGVMVIIQTLALSFMWGQLCRTVEINSGRITAMEDLHPRTDGK